MQFLFKTGFFPRKTSFKLAILREDLGGNGLGQNRYAGAHPSLRGEKKEGPGRGEIGFTLELEQLKR